MRVRVSYGLRADSTPSVPGHHRRMSNTDNQVTFSQHIRRGKREKGWSDMKILMVLTSHDKLGDTGRKTGFWLEEFAAPYCTFLDAGAAVTARFAQRRSAAARPEKRHAGGSNRFDPALQAGSRGPGRVGQDPEARRDESRRPRRGVLSRRPWPDVGLGRGPALHRPHRGVLRRRQTGRRRLPRARRAPSGPVPGPADREGQAVDRLH